MSTQEKATTDAEIIAAIEGARSAVVEAAEVVKLGLRPEAHETLDSMVRAHERMCALATILVRA